MKYIEAIRELLGEPDISDSPEVLSSLFFDGKLKEEYIKCDGITFVTIKGIHWKCTNCGNCCIYENYIDLSIDEVKSGNFIMEDEDDPDTISGKKIKKEIGQPCPYLKDNKCSCHDSSPNVCKRFPAVEISAEAGIKNGYYLSHATKKYECEGWHVGDMQPHHLKKLIPAIKLCKEEEILVTERIKKEIKDNPEMIKEMRERARNSKRFQKRLRDVEIDRKNKEKLVHVEILKNLRGKPEDWTEDFKKLMPKSEEEFLEMMEQNVGVVFNGHKLEKTEDGKYKLIKVDEGDSNGNS